MAESVPERLIHLDRHGIQGNEFPNRTVPWCFLLFGSGSLLRFRDVFGIRKRSCQAGSRRLQRHAPWGILFGLLI